MADDDGNAAAHRVLVIEDDPDVAEMLLAVLEDEGYDARAVTDSREALDAITATKPAVVLLDLVMPEPDGFALAAALRETPETAQIPLVAVTAIHRAAERAAEAGIARVIPKPLDLGELLAELAELLSDSAA